MSLISPPNRTRDYTKVGYDPELGYWDQEWTKGDEWKQYPNVVKFNIWDGMDFLSSEIALDNKHEALIRGQNKSFHYKYVLEPSIQEKLVNILIVLINVRKLYQSYHLSILK